MVTPVSNPTQIQARTAQPQSAGAGLGGPGAGATSGMEAESTQPKFKDVWNDIQTKMGAKPEKPREIKKTLGKDDFLKIMITQMKHQDPTKPFDAEKMAQEMAQITSVEQLQNVNQNLKVLTERQAPLERLGMTHLIGKTVTVDRNRFTHTEGQSDNVSFVLPSDASSVKVELINPQGQVVATKEMGRQKAGVQTFVWDGKQDNTVPGKSGVYQVRVDAKGPNSEALQTTMQVQGRVIGIGTDPSGSVLFIGDNKHQERVTLDSVTKVEEAPLAAQPIAANPLPMQMSAAPPQPQDTQSAQEAETTGVQPPAGMVLGQPGFQKNFMSFAKGEGSKTLPPEMAAELAKVAQAMQLERPAVAELEEKGFPNGLKDDETMKGGEKP